LLLDYEPELHDYHDLLIIRIQLTIQSYIIKSNLLSRFCNLFQIIYGCSPICFFMLRKNLNN